MLYPLSYGGGGVTGWNRRADAERLSGPLGNTRHTRLVTTGETNWRVSGLPSG